MANARTEKIEIDGVGVYELEIPEGQDSLSEDELRSAANEIVSYERNQPRSITEKSGTFGAGANVALADFFGSAVDLVNQMPTLVSRADPGELAEKALYAWRNLSQKISGTPASRTRQEYEAPPPAPPISQNPVGSRRQLRQGLSALNLGYEDISDVPFNLRSYARGGEMVGASAPFAALPFAGQASRLVPTIAPRAAPTTSALATPRGSAGPPVQQATGMFAPIVQKAANRPARFAATEALVAALSGAGAAGAERLRPGDDRTRIAASVAVPLAPNLSALRYAPGAVRAGVNAVRTRTSEAGRRASAADELARAIPDPIKRSDLAEEIRGSTDLDGPITPGQITGDPDLTAIERLLLKTVNDDDLEAVLLAQRAKFDKIVAEGNPRAIQEAAQARVATFNSFLEARVKQAEEMLTAARDKTTPNASRQELNIQARKILDDVEEAASATEKQLFDSLPRNLDVEPVGTIGAFLAQKDLSQTSGSVLPTSSIDPEIDRFINLLIKRTDPKSKTYNDPTISGELITLRSNISRVIRQSARSGAPVKEGALKQIIKGINDDLADVPGINEAMTFSARKNVALREGIVGDILARSGRGEPKTSPEVTLTVARATGREQGSVNFRELREAAGFNAIDTNRPGGVQMEQVQKDFLRRLASETDSYSGEVNLVKLNNFIKSNQEAIESLGLSGVFSDTATAAAVAQRVLKRAEKYKSFNRQKNFASSSIQMDVNKAVKQILLSPNKADELQKFLNLVRVSRTGSDEALKGFRYTIYQQILDAATTKNGLISPKALEDILNSPAYSASIIQGPSRTLRSELTRQGILNAERNKSLDALVEQARKLETSVNTRTANSDMLKKENGLFEIVARVAGASGGRRVARMLGVGGTLQAPSAGARAGIQNLVQIPREKTRQVLIEAIENPALMAKLLDMTVDISGRIAKQRQINAYLIAAGLLTAADEIDDPVAIEELLPGRETAMPTTPLDLSIGPRPPQ